MGLMKGIEDYKGEERKKGNKDTDMNRMHGRRQYWKKAKEK